MQSLAIDPGAPRDNGNFTLFGASIGVQTEVELISAMTSARLPIGSGVKLVVTMNLDHVVRLQNHAAFREAYGRAWAVTLDGAPVWLYSKVKGMRVRRYTGSDLVIDLMSAMRPGLHRPFFVVSSNVTGRLLMERLGLQGFSREDVDFMSPPRGFDADPALSHQLCEAVRNHQATHLIFGLGAPKSEIWIDHHRERLGDLFACSVGSGPDFFVGTARRAPKFVRDAGLEWAWRVAHERQRLFRRYFIESWGFIPAVVRDLANLERPVDTNSEIKR